MDLIIPSYLKARKNTSIFALIYNSFYEAFNN